MVPPRGSIVRPRSRGRVARAIRTRCHDGVLTRPDLHRRAGADGSGADIRGRPVVATGVARTRVLQRPEHGGREWPVLRPVSAWGTRHACSRGAYASSMAGWTRLWSGIRCGVLGVLASRRAAASGCHGRGVVVRLRAVHGVHVRVSHEPRANAHVAAYRHGSDGARADLVDTGAWLCLL